MWPHMIEFLFIVKYKSLFINKIRPLKSNLIADDEIWNAAIKVRKAYVVNLKSTLCRTCRAKRVLFLKQKPRPSVSHGGFDQATTQPYQYDAQHNTQDQIG